MAIIKPDLRAITAEINRQVQEGVSKMSAPLFEPTGALEPVIAAVGNADYRIINLQCANKLGKTTIVANIFKNIFWGPEGFVDKKNNGFFDYSAYREWPFLNDDEKPIKRARIICTPANAAEGGPIDTEIKKWWPEGRYSRQKATKHYFSKYETDTGWFFDIMTFDQEPSEFEGPMISLQWCDEPPRASLMGAIMSRFSKGGILLLSQTPVNAGPFLDVISDLKDRGTKVLEISATIFDNSKTNGKLNSKGTKRGLMSDEEIEDYVKSIPIDERESRLYGRAVGKSGKVYPMFTQEEHIRNYNIDGGAARQWNGYCIMDPHDKYYPFIQWWAVLPPNEIGKTKYVCYNEWPTYKTMGGYYDEMRHSVICNLTPESISKIIKTLDGTNYGIQIVKRGIDPRFARNSESSYTKVVEGLVMDYQQFGIDFELPDQKLMSNARDRIRGLLKYDVQMPTHIYNEPDIFIMSHCVNTIRALDRHYWEDGKDKESEEFKDPCDCARMFFALEAGSGWKKPSVLGYKKEGSGLITNNLEYEFEAALKGIGLC